MKKHLLSFLLVAISFGTFSQITITSTVTNVSCFGLCNGSVTVGVTGGTTPYLYNWSQGSTSPQPTSLCAGMYTLTVTDASSVTATATINITQPSQINATISSTNACYNSCNGSVFATVTGGTPAYNYSWTPNTFGGGGFTPSPYALCPGTYTLTVTDMMGCIATHTTLVTQTPSINIIISYTNSTCGSCNGEATASGATTYTWSNGASSFHISNLCQSVYTVYASNPGGCATSQTVSINSQSSLPIPNATITTTSYDETCLQTGDGAIDLNIVGTNPGPFTYYWSNGATTQDIVNASSSAYWVTVSDGSSNCFTLHDTINPIGINCGSISGNIFIDNNSNCINNVGDNNISNTPVIVNPGNRIGYTNFTGDYVVNNLPFGTYSVTANVNNPSLTATCATSFVTTLNSGSPNATNNNFTREYIPITQPNLFVSANNSGVVPGFVCTVNYYLNNYNSFSANGIYKVTLPSAFIPNITQVSVSTYSISGDTVMWNFTNITSSTFAAFFIKFTTPLSTQLGSIFTTCIWAQPTVTDLNYANNTYCYSRNVTGSFDPNDKTVSPVGVGANGDIAATETDLTYLIRFQNTGNGPAVNIFVKDTLSPNVDINTFEMLGSSHNYMMDVLPGNILRWKFNNIMLPDSNSNEPASHGYIQYRIKRTNNNTPGTQIKNTAYIYFDFNEPVVTNTAINTIETITGIKSSSVNNDEWNVYPNPSTGVLYIVNSSSVKEASQIQVINSIGQTVLEETITSNYKNIDLSKLNNGVYFVKIVSDKYSVIKRVVLSR